MRNFIPFALVFGVLRGADIMGTGAGELLQGTATGDRISALGGDDVVQGLAGNDLIFGDEGNDAIEGGDGNDKLVGGTTTHDDDEGNDFAGGAGNDAIWGTAHGDVYRYASGDGFDLIYEKNAGAGSVDIVSFGNDIAAESVTFGRERGDLMVEISGIDCMRVDSWFAGESGEFRIEEFHFHEAPTILGSALSFEGSVWTGGPGDDIHTASGTTPVLLSGLDGNDTLTGTSAMDVINGGGGADTLHGMGGDDGVYGDAGNDVLYGQDGDDALYGGNDNDTLLGEAGADHLSGGAGNDTQYGDAGNDSYFWNPGGGDDVIQDDTGYAERYATSRLIFGPGVLPADVTTETVPGSSTHIKFQVRASGVPAGSVQVNQWNTLHSYSSIRHGSTWSIEFADGTVWNGAVLATPLADTIAGTAGADQISGGAGNDILSGMDGDDSLAGDEGDDILYAGNGNDILNGGLDNDTLLGEEGADQITGGAGNDTQHGGAGDDVYFWNPGDGDDVIQEDTGYSERYATSRLIFGPGVLPADVTTETVPGSSTHLKFQIRASGVPVGSVQVNQWNALHSYTSIRHCSTWHIEFANGTVWNGATLATPMADTLTGTPGADQMSGGGGNDILSGMDGDDTLAGDAGDDILYGGNDNDTLQGGADADTLFGEAGNDSFLGGDSNDTLFGGPGSDTYFWNPGDGDDTIQDDTWYSETSAVNRLVFGLGVLPSDVVLETVPGSSTHIRFQVRTSGIPSGSVQVNQWNTLHSYTSICHNSTWRIEFADGTVWNGSRLGTPYADTLVGTPGTDQMSGGAGNDSLSGMDGDDSLAGDAGDDSIYGGNGNDTLVGGTGDDILNGGAGADIHVWSSGDGNDSITESFSDTSSENTLRLENIADVGGLDFVREGATKLKIIIPQDGGQAPATISIDNWAALLNNVPFLTMWSLEIPGYEKFRFSNLPGNGADVATGSIGSDLLLGLDGDDDLSGEAGPDFLSGGVGNDALKGGDGVDYLSGGIGSDSLSGGEGNDTYFINLGGGNDEIIEPQTQVPDELNTVVFGHGIHHGSVQPSRSGNDLVLEYENGAGMVIIRNWFADGLRSSAVESVSFADGTTWSRPYVESRTNPSGYTGPFPVGLVDPLQILPAILNHTAQDPTELEVLTPLHQ